MLYGKLPAVFYLKVLIFVILVALGANLSSPATGSPLDSCEKALACLGDRGLTILKRSRWYRSAPVPRSSQPNFVNGVVSVASALPPQEFLATLHEIETELGRTRGQLNEARVIDLDLLCHGDQVIGWPASPPGDEIPTVGLVLPHPRLHGRAFVLLPLRDVAPDWRHPVSGEGLEAMIGAISTGSGAGGPFGDQVCEPLD